MSYPVRCYDEDAESLLSGELAPSNGHLGGRNGGQHRNNHYHHANNRSTILHVNEEGGDDDDDEDNEYETTVFSHSANLLH